MVLRMVKTIPIIRVCDAKRLLDKGGNVDIPRHFKRGGAGTVFAVEEGGIECQEE
jgi:hypothetical protein